MYLEHFGLREFPFSLAPDPRFLYLSAQHREALAHLLYGVRSEGGFVQLTGEVGTGKTTVCRCFLEQLPPGTRAAVILNPGLTAEELLATICDEFEIARPAGPSSIKDSLDRINRYLLERHAAGERAVLIIDEAQNLDAAVLEQVRLLTNLETSRHKLLQIILMGQPELRATLARTDLRQLAQRITARFHLRPLTRQETQSYVRHRLEVAGCSGEIFPAAVIGKLRRLSRGVPRLINILCDRSLLGAFVQGRRQVDRATLAQAAREVAGEEAGEEAGAEAGADIPVRTAVLIALAAGVVMVALLFFASVNRRQPQGVQAPPARMSPAADRVQSPPVAFAPAAPVLAAPAPAAQVAAAVGAGDRLSTGSPAESGGLRALLEQPEGQQQVEAWRRLYRLWGIRARDGENGCSQALVHGLDCLRGEGGLEQLRRLDRPALVRLDDPQGAPRWLVLERLQDRQATLAAAGATTVVDIDTLGGYGIREFVVLWRSPVQSRGALASGDRGPGVAWLMRRLGAAAGTTVEAGADPVFDESVAESVRKFQRSRGLEVDGIAGPETLILLDENPAPGTPTLSRPG